MKPFFSFGVIPLFGFAAGAFAFSPPPPAPVSEVAETLHGVSVADPYRWLEGSDAPEVKRPDPVLDARVRAWSEAQNARTREYLDEVPGRAALVRRLESLFRTDVKSVPVVRGGRAFFSRRKGDATNATVYVRELSTGAERVLLDTDKLYPDGRTVLSETKPSDDGEKLAFSLYKSGDENTTLRIADVATGRWLADALTGKAGGVSWLPGGSAFVYHRLADIRNPYSRQIVLHRLGTPQSADRVIFEQYKSGPLATTYGPSASLDRTGRHLLVSYYTGTRTNDLWVVDFRRWLDTGESRRTVIAEGVPAIHRGQIRGDTLYLFTTDGAPDGRLLKVDLAHPGAPRKELVRGGNGRILDDFALSRNRLALTWSVDALPEVELRDLDGGSPHGLPAPGIGVCRVSVDEATDDAYLTYSSFNEPPVTHRVDTATLRREVYFRTGYDVDPSHYEVKRLFFRSKDGARVPLFVTHRKGLKLDGSNPTVLYGYGGFGAGQRPSFNGAIIPWLDAGGVFALAGLRGGDEYGESWHVAGMLERKQNVFDDFIAAAEHLIREGYTSRAKLGIRGGSNGGLLTGAAITQRPDLFRAAIVGVPLLDMLRYHRFLMAKYWIPEYGDPSRAADFGWLRAYSPYHRVTKGVEYPATLLEAGERDSRVHPMHAKKMAAALQAATSGDPVERPVLLNVDFDSGHGMGKSFGMRVRDTADAQLFFARNLGVDFSKATSEANPEG